MKVTLKKQRRLKKMILFKLFVFLLLVLHVLGINFPFTMPGSKYWPSWAEFFKLRSIINGDVYFRGEIGY